MVVPAEFHRRVHAVMEATAHLGIAVARGVETEHLYDRVSMLREHLYKYGEENLRPDDEVTNLRF